MRAFEDRRVQYSEEFRFSMLRHWSLYDAMTHSPYVATRLQTWREHGRASLHSLLAHLGLPLDACKQQFTHMSPEHVARLHEKLEQHAPRRTGWMTSSSGPSPSLTGSRCGWSRRMSCTASRRCWRASPKARPAPEVRTRAPTRRTAAAARGLWRAVKALGMSQYDEMQVGLRHAMRSQRALMRQGGLALANKTVIRTVGGLRYFSLLDHGSPRTRRRSSIRSRSRGWRCFFKTRCARRRRSSGRWWWSGRACFRRRRRRCGPKRFFRVGGGRHRRASRGRRRRREPLRDVVSTRRRNRARAVSARHVRGFRRASVPAEPGGVHGGALGHRRGEGRQGEDAERRDDGIGIVRRSDYPFERVSSTLSLQ